jgi:hypothetical protein
LSSPALGDIDGDGDLEIVVGGLDGTETLHAFHHDGSAVENFPVLLNHPGSSFNINSSPVICDIDGDTSTVEIVVKANDYIFAIHQDTTTVTGFPYFINDENQSGTYSPSPVIDDFDNDGDVEYAFASIAGKIHFFDMEDVYNKNFELWNSYKHDMQNTSAAFPIEVVTDVKENNSTLPTRFFLNQNYPNPFNSVTTINFKILKNSFISLKIYDVLGNKIATLINEELPAGNYNIKYDAENLPSGMYVYSLNAGSNYLSRKMILLK